VRRQAIKTLQGRGRRIQAAADRQGLAAENARLKAQLELLKAAALLGSSDKAKRLEAARLLAGSGSRPPRPAAERTLQAETEAEVKAAICRPRWQVEGALAWGERLGALFTGISLGSILLLVALGLAITYGLMGVINMAHGELMMIGAYATYVVQNLFQKYLPGAFDWYLWRPCRWPSWPRRWWARCWSAA
jgi:urea transport system permease protein